MTLQEIVTSWLSSGNFWLAIIVIVLALIEITPVKVNPLGWIFKKIGSAFNSEVMKEMGTLKNEMGTVKNEVASIKKDVTDIREEAKEREATSRRARILEFGDEILHDVDYSKEHWDACLMDITAYENYCDDHPHYMNNVAKATILHIKNMYQQHLAADDFL